MKRFLLLCLPLIVGCQATLDVSEAEVSLTLPVDSNPNNDCVAIRATHINDTLGVKEFVFTEGINKPLTLYTGQNDIAAVASANATGICPGTYDAVAMIKAYEASTTMYVAKGNSNTLNLAFRSVGVVGAINGTYTDTDTLLGIIGASVDILPSSVSCYSSRCPDGASGDILVYLSKHLTSVTFETRGDGYDNTVNPLNVVPLYGSLPANFWRITAVPAELICGTDTYLVATSGGESDGITLHIDCQ
jgi:hypothetical protein